MTDPYYAADGVTLHLGESLDILPTLPDASVDAVVCDPPYGLSDLPPATVLAALTAWLSGDRSHVPVGRGFMGRDWDAFVPPPAVWDECLRVLKPGGYLAAFAGARTVDLMALSIRIAGAEIRDSIMWINGSGFPKSANHLKPAHEPIVLARKPFAGTVAATVLQHGTGALNIDGCRTAAGQDYRDKCASVVGLSSNRNGDAYGEWTRTREDSAHEAGRWPTNVLLAHPPLLDHHGQPVGDACVDGCIPGCPVADMDRQSGISGSNARANKGGSMGYRGGTPQSKGWTGEDSGGASRFFPVFRYEAKAPASERPRLPDGTAHTTVKPLALMQWLVRLVTPPGGTVLDPFAGTGTTLSAALREGMQAIGVEKHEPYAQLAVQRLSEPYMVGLFGDIA